MAFPTSGYQPLGVTYTLFCGNGLQVQVIVNAETQLAHAEEMQPYLETALDDLRSAYTTGTSETTELYRQFDGALNAQIRQKE